MVKQEWLVKQGWAGPDLPAKCLGWSQRGQCSRLPGSAYQPNITQMPVYQANSIEWAAEVQPRPSYHKKSLRLPEETLVAFPAQTSPLPCGVLLKTSMTVTGRKPYQAQGYYMNGMKGTGPSDKLVEVTGHTKESSWTRVYGSSPYCQQLHATHCPSSLEQNCL